MTYDEYRKKLDEIQKVMDECYQTPPGDSEMIRGDVARLFNFVSALEEATRFMRPEGVTAEEELTRNG